METREKKRDKDIFQHIIRYYISIKNKGDKMKWKRLVMGQVRKGGGGGNENGGCYRMSNTEFQFIIIIII